MKTTNDKSVSAGKIPEEKPHSKSGGSFEQNPDQNKQIHKQALGPNTKR